MPPPLVPQMSKEAARRGPRGSPAPVEQRQRCVQSPPPRKTYSDPDFGSVGRDCLYSTGLAHAPEGFPMTFRHSRMLTRYNHWANKVMFDAVAALPEGEATKP